MVKFQLRAIYQKPTHLINFIFKCFISFILNEAEQILNLMWCVYSIVQNYN